MQAVRQNCEIDVDLMFNRTGNSCKAYIKESRIKKAYEGMVLDNAKEIAKILKAKYGRKFSSNYIYSIFYDIEGFNEEELEEIINGNFSTIELISFLYEKKRLHPTEDTP